MKKFLTYVLMLAFVVSVFDVLDVSDIRLGVKEIFASDDAFANNDSDDLSEHEYNFSAAVNFILPEVPSLSWVVEVKNTQADSPKNIKTVHVFCPGLISRPPIV